MTDIKSEAKEADSEFPALDLDEDLEVVSEVIEEPLASTIPQDSKPMPSPSPSTTVSNVEPKTTSNWAGLFGRRLGSGKGGSSGAESTTGGPKKRDWSKEQQALNKFKTQAVNTFSQMGTRMGEGGSFLLEASKRRAQATAETLKKIRIFKTPLESLCKMEAVNSPCPRLMLICCTTIAANGLSCKDIFKLDPPETLVSAISEQLHLNNGLVLLPSEAKPEVLAGVVKKFLMGLMEPLLTYGLVEDWIGAGEDLERIKKIMDQLPVVNRNALELLLDCLHRISANAAENNMDPDSLAKALVPCLLWRAPTPSPEPSKKVFSSSGSMTGMFARAPSSEDKGLKMHSLPQDTSSAHDDELESAKHATRRELQGEDFKQFSTVLSFLISNFKPERNAS